MTLHQWIIYKAALTEEKQAEAARKRESRCLYCGEPVHILHVWSVRGVR